jgi:hypothetical protein
MASNSACASAFLIGAMSAVLSPVVSVRTHEMSKPTPPTRNHAVRIECGDAADRELHSPSAHPHRVGGTDNARQCRDVPELNGNLVVELADECFVGIEVRARTRSVARQFPFAFAAPRTNDIHANLASVQTSTTHAVQATGVARDGSAVYVAP